MNRSGFLAVLPGLAALIGIGAVAKTETEPVYSAGELQPLKYELVQAVEGVVIAGPGETYDYPFESFGSVFRVGSTDPDIATADVLKDDTLTITGHKAGACAITVTRPDDIRIEIHVSVRPLGARPVVMKPRSPGWSTMHAAEHPDRFIANYWGQDFFSG